MTPAASTGAGQVTSYLGLVPREYSSGERQYRGRILRSAHPQVQSLLVKRRGACCGQSSPDTGRTATWALGITQRRGKKVAMVALARRLARILLCNVARRNRVSKRIRFAPAPCDKEAMDRLGGQGGHVGFGSERVIKLEEQARVRRLAAIESRSTEGAAPPTESYMVRRQNEGAQRERE